MSIFTDKTSKKIDSIFVLALITLFAATSFVLVLIGAKHYRHVTDVMDTNYEERTVSSYLTEKIRQHDTRDTITITDLENIPALSIRITERDICYTTYIYFYNGFLRELVVTEDSVFSLSAGQEIMELQGFHPKFVDHSLIRAEITGTDGEQNILYFSLHCDTGKEEL